MGAVEYKEITRADLDTYRMLLLPMIYEELSHEESFEEDYICIGAWCDDKPVGAIITLLNDDGGLSLLSVWTDQDYRRQGIASGLLHKMTYVASKLYDWEFGQYGDDVTLTTLYSLSARYREPFEAWLIKNDFTDIMVTREAVDDKPAVCAAMAQIHFFRTE